MAPWALLNRIIMLFVLLSQRTSFPNLFSRAIDISIDMPRMGRVCPIFREYPSNTSSNFREKLIVEVHVTKYQLNKMKFLSCFSKRNKLLFPLHSTYWFLLVPQKEEIHVQFNFARPETQLLIQLTFARFHDFSPFLSKFWI